MLRLLDGLAGLLAAGILVIGILLLGAALVAPGALDAAGLGPAGGPGMASVIAHLAVGVCGEVAIRVRRKWPPSPAVRAVVDCVIVAATGTVLALTWWW